jgi:ketopantoate reductase
VVVRKNQALELLPLLTQNASPCFVFMGNNILGPDEFIKVLGRERVMMGFVFAGGKRDGDLIRAIMLKFARSPFGELDGLLTPRLSRLASILEQGGFKVECSTNIIDTQMTHSVGIAILAALVLKNGGRIRNLAKSSDDMHLFILARREGQKLIQHLGHQVLPESDISRAGLPVSLQIATFRLLLNSIIGEVGLQYHIDQAPDEMQRLILELRQLLSMVNIPLPAIRKALAEKA